MLNQHIVLPHSTRDLQYIDKIVTAYVDLTNSVTAEISNGGQNSLLDLTPLEVKNSEILTSIAALQMQTHSSAL